MYFQFTYFSFHTSKLKSLLETFLKSFLYSSLSVSKKKKKNTMID